MSALAWIGSFALLAWAISLPWRMFAAPYWNKPTAEGCRYMLWRGVEGTALFFLLGSRLMVTVTAVLTLGVAACEVRLRRLEQRLAQLEGRDDG